MRVRNMREKDHQIVLKMAHQFYHTNAVSHIVEDDIIENCFQEALKNFLGFRGLIIENENEIIGYAYLTAYFTTETGGLTQVIEQLYIVESERGKGYGTQFFEWLEKDCSYVSRWRLEVNEDNLRAISLYQKIGFSFIDYRQMVKKKK